MRTFESPDGIRWGVEIAVPGRMTTAFLALLPAGGPLELAIVGENAAAMLGIRVGERVTVSW